uniref:hypothetical protein n=1 Tax=Prevotella sp. TaxID=59823 RepID=UPI003FEF8AE5
MFRKILIFICCVLLSFSAKAQQTFFAFPYGAYLQNEQMMQLAAYVAKKYLYMQKPSELYRK